MKSIDEIISRTVVLLTLSSRCIAEQEYAAGIYHPYEEREEHRKILLRWLRDKGYIDHLTAEERAFFELPIGECDRQESENRLWQCNSLDVLLWVLGLSDSLPDYSDYEVNECYDELEIGPDHTLEHLKLSCHLRSKEEIELQRDVAMLWHWRTIEQRLGRELSGDDTWSDCIIRVFGEEYKPALKCIPKSRKIPCDFKAKRKPLSELNEIWQDAVGVIAYWRHHTFEWILGDDTWDEVPTDT